MKKNKLLIIFLFLIFILPFRVNAQGLCTANAYNKLKKEAFEAELKYELKFDNEHNSYFEIKVYNVSKNVMVIVNDTTYLPKDDGTIELQSVVQGGTTYEFYFYGGYKTDCVEEFLYSKKLKIPKYNKYSERDECIEYEEFPLCNKWYQGDIPNSDYFVEQLNKYILSLKKEEPTPEEKVIEKPLFDKIIDFYVKNIIITLPITIILVGLILFVIIRKIVRRKKRIKLEF